MKKFNRWVSVSFFVAASQILPAQAAWAKDNKAPNLVHSVVYNYEDTRGNVTSIRSFADIVAKASQDNDKFLINVLDDAADMTTTFMSIEKLKTKWHLDTIEDLHKDKDVKLHLAIEYNEKRDLAADSRFKRRLLEARAHWVLTIDGVEHRIPSNPALDIANTQATYLPGDPLLETYKASHPEEYKKEMKKKPHSGLTDKEKDALVAILKAKAKELKDNRVEADRRNDIIKKAGKRFVEAPAQAGADAQATLDPSAKAFDYRGVSVNDRKPAFGTITPAAPGLNIRQVISIYPSSEAPISAAVPAQVILSGGITNAVSLEPSNVRTNVPRSLDAVPVLQKGVTNQPVNVDLGDPDPQ